MRNLLILCISLFPLVLSAQTKGYVVDGKRGIPLANVNIYTLKDSIGIGITNNNGEFSFADSGMGVNDTLVFSYVGYLLFKCTLHTLRQLEYKIKMSEQPQLLNEIVVSGERSPIFLDYMQLAQIPKGLFSFGAFQLENQIYIIAGDETLVYPTKKRDGTIVLEYHSPDMYIYDIVADTWNKQDKTFATRAGHAAHYYKNKIFVLGGKRYSTNRKLEYTDATMEVYDMDKDTIYIDTVNPHQAIDFTSFIYNDFLYVMGGAVKENKFTNKIHALDLRHGVWYEMEDTIPAERCGRMNGILVNHKVYFFGGYRTAPSWTSASYDLHTGKWEKLCDLKDGVSYPGIASHGDYIYIFEKKTLQVYNIKTDSIRIYSLNLNFEGAGLFYSEGNLYIVGGCTRSGIYVSPQNSVYSVDVSRISR